MKTARKIDPPIFLGAFAIAVGLKAAGFAVAPCIAVAWIALLGLSALRAGLQEGNVWFEDPWVAVGVTSMNAAAVLGLLTLGPNYFADAGAIQRGRPAVIGVTGYRLALDDAGKAGVDLGPEPYRAPSKPYFAVPGIPRAMEGRDAVNFPIHFELACSDGRCLAALEPTGPRRDFVVGIRDPSTQQDWLIAGATEVASGQRLRLQEHDILGERLESEAEASRLIPIEFDAQEVRFGACAIERPAEDEQPIYFPVLELRFMTTQDRCELIKIERQDILAGRWLKRAADGGFDIPAHSLFEIGHEHLRFYPLEDLNLIAELVDEQGTPVPAPGPVELEFDEEQDIQLTVMRRLFSEIHLGSAREQSCASQWRAKSSKYGREYGTGCRRLTGSLRGLGFRAGLLQDGQWRFLTVEVDREDPDWGHRVFLDLPYSSWELPADLDATPTPRRHVLLTGRWPAGASLFGGALGEDVLAVPFRLHGTTPYRAVLTLQSEDQDRAVLRIADATRRGEVTASRAELSLGPPDSQALVTYERMGSPHALARGVLWPTVLLTMTMVGLALVGHRLGWSTALLAASVTSTLALIVAFALLQKSLVAYTIMIHPPHDWEAYDQLLVSGLGMPLALAGGAVLALISTNWRPTIQWSAWRVWGLVGLTVLLALARFGLQGKESIGALRFVGLTPFLAALVWLLVIAATKALGSMPSRRQIWLHAGVGISVALLVVSWWTDKGALLMLAIPAALAVVYYFWNLGSRSWVFMLAAGLGFCAIFIAPRAVLELWSTNDGIEIPVVGVSTGSSCGEQPEADDERRVMTQSCRMPLADNEGVGILETLDEEGLLDTTASVSERRHPLRRLDWLEDGAHNSDCNAIDRFPTRDAMEVGFFRALVDRYRGEPRTLYLREQLLPFGPGVTDALLNDYAGLVTYLPQMPRGSFSAVALMLFAVLLMTIGHGRPWHSEAGGVALGAAGLLCGAGILTVAANLDVFPNFAQSIPLLALRSHTALALDMFAMGLLSFGLARHQSSSGEDEVVIEASVEVEEGS